MIKRRVVVVEDDFLILEYISGLCEEIGADVVGTAMNADAALKIIEETSPDYVLMDVRLGEKRDGVDIAARVNNSRPQTKIIFITGSNEPSTVSRMEAQKPYKILIKPIDPDEFRNALQ